MPILQGGGPNPPVSLDPWQDIVGVSWGGKYLAFVVFVTRGATDDFPVSGNPTPTAWPWNWQSEDADPELPLIPDSTYADLSMMAFQYLADTITAGQIWQKDRGWEPDVAISEITGLPELPQTMTFSAWQYAAEVVTGPPRDTFRPQAEWIASGGSPFADPDGEDIYVPGNMSLHFALGDTATIRMRGTAFASGPGTYRTGTGSTIYFSSVTGGVGTIDARNAGAAAKLATENAATFGNLDFALSTMRITARARAWQPVAYVPVGPTLVSGDPAQIQDPGQLWVLCEPILTP